VAKPELGTKRLCASCSAKFYDLGKTPIVCPKCHSVLELAVPRGRPEVPARAVAAPEEETLVPETQAAEFVSLEEADAEAQGKKPQDTKIVEDAEEEIEMDEPLDDAAFIEEQEEGDEDVTDIIGDVEDEEEA
jgi:uncharacterized protein (TIGR02300 family)